VKPAGLDENPNYLSRLWAVPADLVHSRSAAVVTTKDSIIYSLLAVFSRTSLPGSDTTGLFLGPIPEAD